MMVGKKQLARHAFRFLGRRRSIHLMCRLYEAWYRGDGEYAPERSGELLVLQHLMPQCSVVFDVGANVGDWTRSALEINSGATFHLFEPSSDHVQALAESAFPSNVSINQCALSDHVGSAVLRKNPSFPSMNTLGAWTRDPKAWVAREEVNVSTLDEYCHARDIVSVGYLKLDVEGHELSVLKGADSMLRHGAIRHIQFEFNSNACYERVFLRDFFEMLRPLQYAFYKITSLGCIRIDDWHHGLEVYSQSNYLAALDPLPHGLAHGTAVFDSTGYSHCVRA